MVMRKNPQKEAYWRDVVKRQLTTPLSIRKFCAQEGVSENSFYAWRRELALRDRESLALPTTPEHRDQETRSEPTTPGNHSGKSARPATRTRSRNRSTKSVLPTARTSDRSSESALPTAPTHAFIPLQLVEEPQGVLELLHPKGYQLRITGDVNPLALKHVLDVLDQRAER